MATGFPVVRSYRRWELHRMKAAILQRHGGPDGLVYGDLPAPEPAAGEVLVAVRATTVNRADLVIRRGYPGLQLPLPHVLGGDVAGEVAAVGPGVDGWQRGDPVVCYPIVLPDTADPDQYWRAAWRHLGMHRHGGYAERVAVPASCLVRLPGGVDFGAAACLPVAGLTAEHALNLAGSVAGGSLFFWGGAGGLGTLLVPLARLRGVRVFTTARTEARRNLLRSLGADLVLDPAAPDLVDQVHRAAAGGVDAVLDYVGPETHARSFALLRPGGTLLWCGMLTGRETTVNIQALYLRHARIQGFFLGTRAELETLVDHVAAGRLRPRIAHELPLAEAARAHALMEAGKVAGKIVLQP